MSDESTHGDASRGIEQDDSAAGPQLKALSPEGEIPVPRPSASVLLLRDGSQGLEVYMMRRHEKSNVLGGAYVFPGGKLDREDSDDAAVARLSASPDELARSLGERGLAPMTAASLFYAACRETFEEARVLFARDRSSSHGGTASAEDSERAWAMMREGKSFGQVLDRLDLMVDDAAMAPWSRWITPRVPSMFAGRRFDTRFFVAKLPADQQAGFDEHEAVDGEWINPKVALHRYAEHAITLAPPQIMSFVQLAKARTADQVIEAARRTFPRTIEPEPFELEGARVVCYPGDEHHPVREVAMIGPTRLIRRRKIFEPPGGIEALLKWLDE